MHTFGLSSSCILFCRCVRRLSPSFVLRDCAQAQAQKHEALAAHWAHTQAPPQEATFSPSRSERSWVKCPRRSDNCHASPAGATKPSKILGPATQKRTQKCVSTSMTQAHTNDMRAVSKLSGTIARVATGGSPDESSRLRVLLIEMRKLRQVGLIEDQDWARSSSASAKGQGEVSRNLAALK